MTHLTDAPPGYNSVSGVPGSRLNYAEHVYSNSACLPAFVVFYSYS
jgi:hypothetical protein